MPTSLTPSQQLIAKDMSEAALQTNVCDALERFGWLYYHTYDSRRSNKGFPDVVAVRGGRLIVAELKGYSKRGRLGKMSDDQMAWMQKLGQVECVVSGDRCVAYHLWTPDDWLSGEIETVLR